eukprot:s23_g8.t1
MRLHGTKLRMQCQVSLLEFHVLHSQAVAVILNALVTSDCIREFTDHQASQIGFGGLEALDLTDFLDALDVPDDDELDEDDEDDLELPFGEDVFLGGAWEARAYAGVMSQHSWAETWQTRHSVMPSTGHSASTPKKMTGGVGTWRYMAPEVVRHEQYTDRADIYALSLIGYFLLSGRQPFDTFCGRDVEKILKAYLAGKEPRPELGIFIGSMEMRAFLQDTWHVEAPKRPSASECLARLGEIRQHGILHSVSLMTKNFKRSISGPPQA